MSLQEIKTKNLTARLISENIVENVVHDNSTLDVEDILEIKEINKKLTNGNKYVLLVDSGMITTITKEGRELSASPEFQQNTIAKALYVRSYGHRLIGNVYIKLNKPAIKTRIFSCRDQALEWLNSEIRPSLLQA